MVFAWRARTKSIPWMIKNLSYLKLFVGLFWLNKRSAFNMKMKPIEHATSEVRNVNII